MMATTIKTKNSTTGSTVPTGLVQGELAVNITDKKLYVGDAVGNSVQIAGQGATNAAGGSNTQVQYNSSGALAGSSSFVFDGTNVGIGTSTAYTNSKLAVTTGMTVVANNETWYHSNVPNNGTDLKIWRFGGVSGGALAFQTVNDAYSSATERMRLDSSGNLGLGVTPSAWTSAWKSLSILSNGSLVSQDNGNFDVINNAYYDGTNWKYKTTNYASAYIQQVNGVHVWQYAASGSAGANLTWSEGMRLDASGNLGIGTSSPVNYGTNYKTVTINGSTTGVLDIQANGTTQLELSTGTNYAQISAVGASGVLAFTTAGNTERMRIDSSGNVGIGTNSPSQLLSIYSGAAAAKINIKGFGAATGMFVGMDSATDAQIWNSQNGFMRFATNDTERMRIDSSGNLLVGTTSALSNSGAGLKIQYNSGTGPCFATVGSASTNSDECFKAYSTGAAAYRFYVDWGGTIHATSTSIAAISDGTLKENVRPLETGLAEIMALQPRRFDWKNGDATNVAGFIAQEVETVLPELVVEQKYSLDENDNDIMKKSLKMGDMIPTLVKAIQELKAEVDALKAAK
jgi:hypothetical protein